MSPMPRSLPLSALLVLLSAPALRAQDLEERVQKLEQDNAELRHQVGALTGELERFDLGEVFTPLGEGSWGLSPGASKVYHSDQGLSIGGYGEALYQNFAGSSTDQFDLLRVVLYFGYKFSESFVFNSEIEYEHATAEDGDVAVEFAYVDWLVQEALNFRAGLLLVPMGLVNELHEPTSYLGATRPETERRLLPSTWRENGLGVFGDAGPLSYRAYVVTGFDAEGFDAGGLRGGRQKGSEAKAEDLAVVARVDWTDTPGLLAGASAYHGDSGQDGAGLGDTSVTLAEAHVDYRASGWRLRALAAMGEVDDVAELNAAQGLAGAASVGEELEGAYVELAYDVLDLLDPESGASLQPYVRWETIDTQAEVPGGFASDPANDDEIVSVGLQFQPIPQLVVKLEHQDWDGDDDRVNLLLGYTF